MRHIWKRILERWRTEWNEDLARTRAASEAAEMEFRQKLQEALSRLAESERVAELTRRDLDLLAEKSGEYKQALLELQQRMDILDAVFDGGRSFW